MCICSKKIPSYITCFNRTENAVQGKGPHSLTVKPSQTHNALVNGQRRFHNDTHARAFLRLPRQRGGTVLERYLHPCMTHAILVGADCKLSGREIVRSPWRIFLFVATQLPWVITLHIGPLFLACTSFKPSSEYDTLILLRSNYAYHYHA